jgi:maleate isomerase
MDAHARPLIYERLDAETEAGIGARARVGLIVLRTDQTIEYEARAIMARLDGVALYQARIFNDFEIKRETLMAMLPLIPGAAALLPAAWSFDAIGFGCTSAAMLMGDAAIADAVASVHAGAKVSNPVLACIKAMEALEARRIAVVTPYSKAVNEAIAGGLEARGLSISAFVSFEEPDDNRVARISPHSISAAVSKAAGLAPCDAVFISCTSLRAVAAMGAMEVMAGKPVTSSNHALLWHLLRLAGINDRLPDFGRLFSL